METGSNLFPVWIVQSDPRRAPSNWHHFWFRFWNKFDFRLWLHSDSII